MSYFFQNIQFGVLPRIHEEENDRLSPIEPLVLTGALRQKIHYCYIMDNLLHYSKLLTIILDEPASRGQFHKIL